LGPEFAGPLRGGDLRLRRLTQQLMSAREMPRLDFQLGLIDEFSSRRIVRVQRRNPLWA
jgi:hypothetical protein